MISREVVEKAFARLHFLGTSVAERDLMKASGSEKAQFLELEAGLDNPEALFEAQERIFACLTAEHCENVLQGRGRTLQEFVDYLAMTCLVVGLTIGREEARMAKEMDDSLGL